MPNMQLSAFADTKIPLKQNPSSCSTFNHFCDKKVLREEASNMRTTDRKCWECDGDTVRVCCPGLEQVVSNLRGNIVTFSHIVSWKSPSAKEIPAPFSKLLEKKKKIQAKACPPDAVMLAGASFGCRRACITQTPLVWSFSGIWGWANPDTCWPLCKSVMSKHNGIVLQSKTKLWKLCPFHAHCSQYRLQTSCGRANHAHSSGSGVRLVALTRTDGRLHGTWADSALTELSCPKQCSK